MNHVNVSHKVTVLMSVYNAEAYVADAIVSVLQQTYKNFEFLIVNDASTDRSLEIIRSFQDSRIKIICNERNLGLTKSLNIGLKLASGEYIARMDADDISLPERLGVECAFLEQNPCIDLVGSQAAFIDHNGKELKIWQVALNHDDILNVLQSGNAFCHGSVMFRRHVIGLVGYYRDKFRYAQDYDLWLRMSEIIKMANINQILYKFRQHPGSISMSKLNDQLNFHLLAVGLARQRHETGSDDYVDVDNDQVLNFLFSKGLFKKNDVKDFKSERFIASGLQALYLNHRQEALCLLLRGLCISPAFWKLKNIFMKVFKSQAG